MLFTGETLGSVQDALVLCFYDILETKVHKIL